MCKGRSSNRWLKGNFGGSLSHEVVPGNLLFFTLQVLCVYVMASGFMLYGIPGVFVFMCISFVFPLLLYLFLLNCLFLF